MRRSHLADGFGGPGNHYSSQMVEEENENLTGVLEGKVQALKSLTIDIGQEVREQNKLLKNMDTDFDNSGGFLRSTMGRVTALAKSGQHCHIVYLLLFALFVCFIVWLIIKTR